MSQNLTTIRRDNNLLQPLSITTSTAGGFSMGAYAGGMLFCTAASGATIKFFARRSESDATSFALQYSTGGDITMGVSANNAYPLPDEVFAAPFVSILCTAGSATLVVALKG